MDKWLKDILPDKDPYHNRGRDQMRKKRGSRIRVPVLLPDTKERRSVKIIKIYIMFSYVLFHEHFILNEKLYKII
jgi:hypothetical protein